MSTPTPVVIGLGELLWDVFPDGKQPGGAPANFAFQAQQLGCQGVVVSRVGTDEDGDALVEFLTKKSLRIDAIQRDPDAPTGRVTVALAGGQPSYVIHENVAWDFLSVDDTLTTTMQSADAVCFGTLAQRSPVSRQTIQTAVELTSAAALRVYDVNLRQHYYQRDWIEASLTRANVVKLNDEEVNTLAPLLGLPADETEFSRSLLERWSLRLVCVTRGARGCLVTDAAESVSVEGRPVDVVDTVGAGDAFTAGLVVAQLKGWSLEKSGHFANRIGGMVAGQAGAMPDLREAFAELLSQQ